MQESARKQVLNAFHIADRITSNAALAATVESLCSTPFGIADRITYDGNVRRTTRRVVLNAFRHR